jgi:hypothetical protein
MEVNRRDGRTQHDPSLFPPAGRLKTAASNQIEIGLSSDTLPFSSSVFFQSIFSF